MYACKENTKKTKFFVGITVKQIKFIIHPEFMVVNHIIADQFIQNLKSYPNKVHDLLSEIKISLKKQRLEKGIKLQIHKITRITDNNGKIEYHGRTYANNVVALEPSWIRKNFEFSEPELSRIQPGSNATLLFAYVIPWYSILPLLSVMRVIFCICGFIIFSNLCF